jgi:hypothetical protein
VAFPVDLVVGALYCQFVRSMAPRPDAVSIVCQVRVGWTGWCRHRRHATFRLRTDGRMNNMGVSFKEAVWNDIASFVTAIFYLFYLTCLLLLVVYVGLLGGSPPIESLSEILLGYALITVVAIAVLRFRVARISQTLRHGQTVEARVLRGSHFQQFALLVLEYTVREEVIKKQMWLPNTKGPRRLTGEELVELVFDPEKPGRCVARDLYRTD